MTQFYSSTIVALCPVAASSIETKAGDSKLGPIPYSD